MIKKEAVKTAPRGRIYFVGIGGIGLSALARYFKFHGYRVAGSDSARSIITDALKSEGISVTIGHKRENIKSKISFIVYSRAISPASNPELLEAQRLGISIVPYAKVLGELTRQYATIAITGSHGKSTTTALAALALIKGGLDPTVLIGTNLREFGGKNIRIGKNSAPNSPRATRRPNYLVLEADDFGGAFLEYSPAISIVTNIDREHMDFYKTFGGVQRAFLKFMARTRAGGTLILNRDDKILYSLKSKIVAIAKKKKVTTIWYSIHTHASRDRYKFAIANLKRTMKLPGEHNLLNASAALALGTLLKIPEKKTLAALGAYTGSWRRMEYRGIATFSAGEPGGTRSNIKTLVYDDYAHHPTEIKATLKAFREKFPRSSLICIFQPHQAKRLQILFREFTSAFNDADILILLPFYKVPGRDDSNPKYTSIRLARAITKKYPHKKIYYLENPQNIKSALEKLLPSTVSSVVVMMGAGDIVKYTDLLI
jgi:UDP-N-acetylmuramate--alanine ligase